ncbi:LTA synthase family protein [Alkalicoccobacillus murimartini]|uniref:Sulfatase n=1 Tax=Alkalicoccobacillus murimartini TaxID=171685 RepID=A0ABT9YJ06_9BACI|nr:LTA synthase family protein [Alkalicoccobacillus murimartini]MDQ0207843.1 putative sulfatase [Alkalicoccobacillus murimartini]
MERIKSAISRLKLYWLAVLFLTIKSYILYKVGFNISSDNMLQEFILIINPLSSAVLFFAIALLFKHRLRNIMIVAFSLIATMLLYFNLLYYRFFTDFLTLPVLFQTSNLNDLGSSIVGLTHAADLLLLVDLIFLTVLIATKRVPAVHRLKREPIILVSLAVVMFLANLSIAQAERPQLLSRSFDRELLVKNIGILNYHVYDGYIQSQSRAQRVFADSSDIVEVKNYAQANHKDPDPELFGIAEGKNVVMISLESLQTFVINNTVNGEEVTPFLNELIEDSYYFENFYHQTAQGKTSDSEFIVDNSMFGRDSGSVFFTHGGNDYNALPEFLSNEGMYTSVMHSNNKSFWNRDIMYQSLGYDQFFDVNSYDVTEENSVGWGLKDVDFFEQSIDLLQSQPEPFYTKFITLTNHFPFELDEEDKMIDEYDSNSGTLNRFFPTVRYMDHAVERFFEEMKESGMYEDTIFILYGDHYGISENHNRAMSQYLDKDEITPFDSTQLQRVPMIVHIPGHDKSETISTVGGQIDVKPTLMHLLGHSTRNEIHFGTDLFAPENESRAVLRNGSVITDDIVYTNNTCYDKQGEEIEMESCDPDIEKGLSDLEHSDRIIYGDLLRFLDSEEVEEQEE